MDLDIIRQEIDQIDDQIVKLLEERMHLVEGVVAYKKASGKPILDTKREEVIFEKVRSPCRGQALSGDYCSDFFGHTQTFA